MTVRRLGRYEDAERHLREAIEAERRATVPDSVSLLGSLLQLGDMLDVDLARDREAELLFGEVLAAPLVDQSRSLFLRIWVLNSLARMRAEQGRHDAALALREEVLTIHRRTYGDGHPAVANAMASLAVALREAGRIEAGDTLIRQAIDIDLAVFGMHHPSYASHMLALGDFLFDQGRLDEAASTYRISFDVRRDLQGPDHPVLVQGLIPQARLARVRGSFEVADSILGEAMRIASLHTSEDATLPASIHLAWAELFTAWGRPEDAARHRRLAGR